MDAVLNQGMPAPIDVQVSGMDLNSANNIAQNLAREIKAVPSVSDVYIPQDMDYPALQLNVNRERASQLGLSPKGSGGQCDHCSYLRRDDRAQLLGRSKNRQQLFRERAVSGKSGEVD